jgi:hypothetical protein
MSKPRDFPIGCAIRGCLAPATFGLPYHVEVRFDGASRIGKCGLCDTHAAAWDLFECQRVAERVRHFVSLTSGVEAAGPAIVPPAKFDG